MTITDDELKAFVERLNICPTCSAAWDYSRPAAITHGDGTPTGQVRCVHCKAVYDDPNTVKAIVTELLALRQSSPPYGQTAPDAWWTDIFESLPNGKLSRLLLTADQVKNPDPDWKPLVFATPSAGEEH